MEVQRKSWEHSIRSVLEVAKITVITVKSAAPNNLITTNKQKRPSPKLTLGPERLDEAHHILLDQSHWVLGPQKWVVSCRFWEVFLVFCLGARDECTILSAWLKCRNSRLISTSRFKMGWVHLMRNTSYALQVFFKIETSKKESRVGPTVLKAFPVL
jgi:hypothetical protein